jgi:hypothetical protein
MWKTYSVPCDSALNKFYCITNHLCVRNCNIPLCAVNSYNLFCVRNTNTLLCVENTMNHLCVSNSSTLLCVEILILICVLKT